jgi:hypothetical protein
MENRPGFTNNAYQETTARPLPPIGGLHPAWIGG